MILKQLLKNKIKHITILLTFILILPMLGCGNDDSEFLIKKDVLLLLEQLHQ